MTQGKTIFTLTFAVEIKSADDWQERAKEGWVDAGHPIDGCKLAYTLYPGQSFDVDVLIWPHFAKVLSNGPAPQPSCMVRTWHYENKRFVTFSIRHMFAVRVQELLTFTANVSPSFGLLCVGSAIRGKNLQTVFFCPIPFGFKRYFGEVINADVESFEDFLTNLIWECVEQHIPESLADGMYNAPKPVTDVRHRDTIFSNIQEFVLKLNGSRFNRRKTMDRRKTTVKPSTALSYKGKVIEKDKKGAEKKGKENKADEEMQIPTTKKYTLELPGMEMLAGAGRLVRFYSIGDKSPEATEVIILLSSSNLPADDDNPIVFLNIKDLIQVPGNALKKLRISSLYTRWNLEHHTHDSQCVPLYRDTNLINFSDHFVIPLELETGPRILASFWDMPFKVEIRGIRDPPPEETPMLFGHEKTDINHSNPIHDISKTSTKITDVPVALCTVDLRSLAKGMNGLVRGEYFVNPMPIEIPNLQREEVCTNDINAIRRVIPRQVVPNSVILEAQMTLNVEVGHVGCRIPKLTICYSRLYCLTDDTVSVRTIFLYIAELNEEAAVSKERHKLLTGFAVDLGNKVFLVVEGLRDGNILSVWERCIDYYKTMKPVFNSSSRFTDRLYPELEAATVPFIILKMHASLSSILACPAVYLNLTTPLPARTALLKLGRLFYKSLTEQPSRLDLPTFNELRSFRLEFCAPPKPMPGSEYILYSKALVEMMTRLSVPNLHKRENLRPRVRPLLCSESSRTVSHSQAPLERARPLLNSVLTAHPQCDLFASAVGCFMNECQRVVEENARGSSVNY